MLSIQSEYFSKIFRLPSSCFSWRSSVLCAQSGVTHCSVFMITRLQAASPNAEPINSSKAFKIYIYIYFFNFDTLLEVLAMIRITKQYIQNNATKEMIKKKIPGIVTIDFYFYWGVLEQLGECCSLNHCSC